MVRIVTLCNKPFPGAVGERSLDALTLRRPPFSAFSPQRLAFADATAVTAATAVTGCYRNVTAP